MSGRIDWAPLFIGALLCFFFFFPRFLSLSPEVILSFLLSFRRLKHSEHPFFFLPPFRLDLVSFGCVQKNEVTVHAPGGERGSLRFIFLCLWDVERNDASPIWKPPVIETFFLIYFFGFTEDFLVYLDDDDEDVGLSVGSGVVASLQIPEGNGLLWPRQRGGGRSPSPAWLSGSAHLAIHRPALPKTLEGRSGAETPVPITWPCIVCFLQFVSAESSVQSCCCWSVLAFLSVVVAWLVGLFVCFFAVFELVASAFRRAASGAPSRAAHFDLLVL